MEEEKDSDKYLVLLFVLVDGGDMEPTWWVDQQLRLEEMRAIKASGKSFYKTMISDSEYTSRTSQSGLESYSDWFLLYAPEFFSDEFAGVLQ
ncbi:hypothetical protein AKJ16_DCAP11712 [Drosera capensis]